MRHEYIQECLSLSLCVYYTLRETYIIKYISLDGKIDLKKKNSGVTHKLEKNFTRSVPILLLTIFIVRHYYSCILTRVASKANVYKCTSKMF